MTAAKIVDLYTQAWIRGDLSAARSHLADDLSFEGSVETHRNADTFINQGLKTFREQLFAGFTPLERVDGERTVFKLYDCQLTTGGSLRCAEYFEVEGDKIKTIRLVFDTGRLPRPAA